MIIGNNNLMREGFKHFDSTDYSVTLITPEKSFTIRCKRNETIVEAAEHFGIELPYCCLSACCRVCVGKVIKGKLKHKDEDDVRAVLGEDYDTGHSLLCNACPASDCTIVTHIEEE